MRINRETLFNILNLQTLNSEGMMINLFAQRGDADYVIEVVGSSTGRASNNRPLDE